MSQKVKAKYQNFYDECHYLTQNDFVNIKMMLQELTDFKLFHDLNETDLALLSRYTTLRFFPAGSVIVEQYETANFIFLIITGTVEIRYKPYDGPELTLSTVSEGGVIGWSAALGHATYTATAIASNDVQALMLWGNGLRDLLKKDPVTGQRIIDRLAQSVSTHWGNAQRQVKSMLQEQRGLSSKDTPQTRGRAMTLPKDTTKVEQIQALIERLSAYIEQYHGGSVEFVSYADNILTVRLGGACLGCPLLPSTLHGWVEGTVKQFFPEIQRVESV